MSGRILIDIYGYNKHHGGLQRTENKAKQAVQNVYDPTLSLHSPANVPVPPVTPNNEAEAENSAYIKRLSDEEQQNNKDEMLARPHDLVFLSPILTGFSLKDKLWRQY